MIPEDKIEYCILQIILNVRERESEEEVEMSSVREFRPGCLVRLRMEDFMHYHDQTVQPAPGFNVVIGHNGSGKSAIVNAICIGLGKSDSFV